MKKNKSLKVGLDGVEIDDPMNTPIEQRYAEYEVPLRPKVVRTIRSERSSVRSDPYLSG